LLAAKEVDEKAVDALADAKTGNHKAVDALAHAEKVNDKAIGALATAARTADDKAVIRQQSLGAHAGARGTSKSSIILMRLRFFLMPGHFQGGSVVMSGHFRHSYYQ
jgi:hypothetical protein